MNLQLVGTRVNRCDFENKMGPDMKLNLQISTNNQIKLPREFRKGAVGTVITKIMIGSPMQPIYLYMEHLSSFTDVDATEESCEDVDTMMSLFRTICVPVAMKELESTIQGLCRCYHIPEIKLQKDMAD